MAVVVYFSRAGENVIDGQHVVTPVGNTAVVARKIADQRHLPLMEILPVIPYPKSYQATLEIAKEKKNAKERPAIKPLKLPETEALYLGYPIWWGCHQWKCLVFWIKSIFQG
ncbi:MAG: hypothetical protein Q4A67_02415 [Aerococcus sp.]|nr:hypothetical protein [Aerococcus sp.]